MTMAWRGGELRVELAGDKPGMIGDFNDLNQSTIHRTTGDFHAGRDNVIQVAVVELIAMTMALRDHILSVELAGQAAGLQVTLLTAEPHCTPQVGAFVAFFQLPVGIQPLHNQADYRIGRRTIELGAVGARQTRNMAGELNHRHLHPQADTQVGDTLFPGIANRFDFAFYASVAETAGHQNGIHTLQVLRAAFLDLL